MVHVPGRLLLAKAWRVARRKLGAATGSMLPLTRVLREMAARPFELHLELTNLCNANCVFCPYQFQVREVAFMGEEVFRRAVDDFVAAGGGSVGLTPIVGDALIHPDFVGRVRYLRSLDRIDRIWVTTNGILIDKHGARAILESGLTAITISTAGFHEESYRRIYRNHSYQRFRRNVLALVEENAARSTPVHVTIGLRTDRALDDVMRDVDFQPILAHGPELDFTWSFTSAGGRITREALPHGMRLRTVARRAEACVQLYNGPIVLPDGTVMACSCVASMDAMADLGLGNVLRENLVDLWRGPRMAEIRSGFDAGAPNPTCAGCDMYRNLELYRTAEGRKRARLNGARGRGVVVARVDPPRGAFSGG